MPRGQGLGLVATTSVPAGPISSSPELCLLLRRCGRRPHFPGTHSGISHGEPGHGGDRSQWIAASLSHPPSGYFSFARARARHHKLPTAGHLCDVLYSGLFCLDVLLPEVSDPQIYPQASLGLGLRPFVPEMTLGNKLSEWDFGGDYPPVRRQAPHLQRPVREKAPQ